mmetsp:Transcript_11525/g.29081  ORF Transcript_11525/g.29081 Transcript_11525/m.29081 type:complete len:235 (+) Transcript_11525:77-781(+)
MPSCAIFLAHCGSVSPPGTAPSLHQLGRGDRGGAPRGRSRLPGGRAARVCPPPGHQAALVRHLLGRLPRALLRSGGRGGPPPPGRGGGAGGGAVTPRARALSPPTRRLRGVEQRRRRADRRAARRGRHRRPVRVQPLHPPGGAELGHGGGGVSLEERGAAGLRRHAPPRGVAEEGRRPGGAADGLRGRRIGAAPTSSTGDITAWNAPPPPQTHTHTRDPWACGFFPFVWSPTYG